MSKLAPLALLALFLMPAFAFAQAAPPTGTAPADTAAYEAGGTFLFPPGHGSVAIGVGLGLGLIVIGAGRGIGAIGSHAVDAIARQPEAAGNISTAMIVSAALIEGATLFAIVVALLLLFFRG